MEADIVKWKLLAQLTGLAIPRWNEYFRPNGRPQGRACSGLAGVPADMQIRSYPFIISSNVLV